MASEPPTQPADGPEEASAPPALPPLAPLPLPNIALRPSRPPGRPSEDTLLSAPVPSEDSETLFDERLTRAEMRWIELDARLRELEQGKTRGRAGAREWLVWLALAGLLLLAYKVLLG